MWGGRWWEEREPSGTSDSEAESVWLAFAGVRTVVRVNECETNISYTVELTRPVQEPRKNRPSLGAVLFHSMARRADLGYKIVCQ